MAVSSDGSVGRQNCSWTAGGRLWSWDTGTFWDLLTDKVWLAWPQEHWSHVSWRDPGGLARLLMDYNLEWLLSGVGLFQDLWGQSWACLLLGPWTTSTTCGPRLVGARTQLWGHFRICHQLDFGSLASRSSQTKANKGVRARSPSTLESTPGIEVCVPITKSFAGVTPLGSLGIWF